jgi:hypothetical protein
MKLGTDPSIPAPEIPSGLKKFLLAGLFISAAAGFACTVLLTGTARSAFLSLIPTPTQRIQLPEVKLSEWAQSSTFIPSVSQKEPAFYQGLLTGAGGKAMAVIDGQPVTEGDQVNGIRILQLSGSTLSVEINGRTVTLEPGDRLPIR